MFHRADDALDNPFTRTVLSDVGRGSQYASTGIKYVRVAKEAGFENDAVNFVAGIGSDSYANVSRDMHARFEHLYPMEVYPLPCHLYQRHSWDIESTTVSCLAPYELFSSMYNFKRQFELSMFGPNGVTGVQDYWQQHMRSQWGREHPVNSKTEMDPALVIPWIWHSDGAEIFDGTEFHILSWSSAMSQHTTDVMDQKFM